MNAPLSRAALSDAMPLAINYLKEGIATSKHHLPTIVKLTLPYIGISALTALLFATGIESLPGGLTPADMQNPEVAREAAQAVALPLFAFALVVLPVGAYTLFTVMRFASQDPLPEPATQTMSGLWRFGTGFFGYMLLSFVLGILAVVISLPAMLVSMVLAMLLFFLPVSFVTFLAGLPMEFAAGLIGAFFAVTSMAFFKSPQDGMTPAISRGRSVMTSNIPIWAMLSVIGGIGALLQTGFNGALASSSSPFPVFGMALSPVVSLAVSIPLLFTFRAAAKR